MCCGLGYSFLLIKGKYKTNNMVGNILNNKYLSGILMCEF